MSGGNDRWCVLRMAASRTLAVERSLRLAGLKVWTPIEIQVGRKSGSKAKQERTIALLATFVFAREEHLHALQMLQADPLAHGHLPFSLMRVAGGHVLIRSEHLEGLRAFERELARPVPKREPVFTVGDDVKVDRDAFASMNGVIIEEKGKNFLVGFPGWRIPVEVSPCEIELANVDNSEPEQGSAAQEAA